MGQGTTIAVVFVVATGSLAVFLGLPACRACDDFSQVPRYEAVDAQTGEVLCATVEVFDGDERIVSDASRNDGDGTCASFDATIKENGTYLFRVQVPGYKTAEADIELSDGPSTCNEAEVAAFDGDDPVYDRPLQFKMTRQ